MRSLNKREKTLLTVLAVGAAALWIGIQKAPPTPESAAGGLSRYGHPGEPPVVRLDLLDAGRHMFDPIGRNLFAYHVPKQAARSAERVSRIPDPPPPPIPVSDDPVPPSPTKPAPPDPKFDYIGLLGPKGGVIAVFYKESGVFVAQIGDVIDEHFMLLGFRYGAVVLGYVNEKYGGETLTLPRSTG